MGGATEIDAAVDAARQAFPRWRALPANQRRAMLLRLCQLIDDDAPRLAWLQIIESGVPQMLATRMPGAAVDYLAYNAGWIDKLGGDVAPTWPGPALDFVVNEPY